MLRLGAYRRPHKHHREYVASCEDFSQPLKQEWGYIRVHHLAHYMFAARCRTDKMYQFTKFLHLIATIVWNECPTPSES